MEDNKERGASKRSNGGGPEQPSEVNCVLHPTCLKKFKGMCYMWQHAHHRHGIDQYEYESMYTTGGRGSSNVFGVPSAPQAPPLLDQLQHHQLQQQLQQQQQMLLLQHQLQMQQQRQQQQKEEKPAFTWRGPISLCSLCEEHIPSSCWESHAALHLHEK